MATKHYARSLTATQRRAAIAKIHIGKKQLDLDDETYRALLHSVAGQDSTADMSDSGLQRVLDHLRKAGAVFKNTPKAGKKPHTMRTGTAPGGSSTSSFPGRPVETREDQLRKIEALLTDRGLPWRYLTARQDGNAPSMLMRLTGIERLEWCNGVQLAKVIAALAIQQKRAAKQRTGTAPGGSST